MPRGVPRNGSNSGWFRRGVSQVKTAEHRRKIGEAQRLAWATKRTRLPVGSKWIDASGYVRVKVKAGAGRWRLEHALVMEKRLGRALRREEIVHHIDGNRQNNTDENLYLCRDNRHHMEVERQLKETFRELLKRNVVTFSQALGIYSCH